MKRLVIVLSVMTLGLFVYAFVPRDTEQNIQDEIDVRVAEILSKMTLEEKVGQMTQVTLNVICKGNIFDDKKPEPAELDEERMKIAFGRYKLGSVLNNANNKARSLEFWHETINRIQEVAIKETGIPVIYGIDAIHGTTYTLGGILFPQQIGQAATFNLDYIRQLNEVTAYEMRASNIPWTFSPVLDMGRDPRNPRMWETYGEDVFLNGTMGAAAVEAFQGKDAETIDQTHGAVCLKHYIGYTSTSGKDRTPFYTHPRDFYEKHVMAFQLPIDAGAKTVMINSGIINGVPVHSSYNILTVLLREEMGFKGIVVSDWADIKNLYTRDKIAKTEKEAVMLAINAGIDMSMVPYGFDFCDYLIDLVNEGEVKMSRIDEAVSRILRVKIELGLFEHPTTDYNNYKEFASNAHKELARKIAEESITLLKNEDNVLPLKKGSKILVAGPNANYMRPMNGGWSYSWQGERVDEYAQEYNSFLEAMQNQAGKQNISFVEGVSYNMDLNARYFEEINIDITSAVKAAADVDYIVLFLGENSYTEKPGDLHDLYISENQSNLAIELSKTGKPVILVLNEGRPRIISKFEDKMAAVIQTYLPGNFGGDALANILFGEVNPSGKLPYTYPMFSNTLVNYDYKPSEAMSKPEGVYDYSSDYAVQYEFGFGLSYTRFEYSNLKVSSPSMKGNESARVTLEVKNTGEMAGKETVLLFTSDLVASVTPDNKRLRAFKKIDLEPGQVTTVEFSLSPRDLAFYNQKMQLVAEKGDFLIKVGDISDTISLSEDVVFGEYNKVRL